jgi:Flp pilus assembly pilin Flp
MAHLYWYLRALLGSLLSDDRAQDAWEYILVIGAISVVVIAAMVLAPGLVSGLVTAVCQGINAVLPNSVGGEGITQLSC